MNALKWLIDLLRDRFRLSRGQIFFMVVPLCLVIVFAVLFAALKKLGLPDPWSVAISAWLVFVWLLWIPLAPKIFRRKEAASLALLLMIPVLIGALSMIWILVGGQSLRVPFLAGGVLGMTAWLLQRYKPELLPYATQLSGFIVFTLLAFSLPVRWQRLQGAIPPTTPYHVGVWVAQFDLDTDRKVQAGIIEQLNYVIRRDPSLKSVVEIKDLQRPITGQTESERFKRAQELGRELNGDIVVFGTLTNRGVSTKIAVVGPPSGFTGSELALFVNNIADIPSVDVELSYLIAKVITGFTYYQIGKCSVAETQFRGALSQFQKIREVVPPESLRLYRASSIVCQALAALDGSRRLQEAIPIYMEVSNSKNPWTAAAGRNGLGHVYRRLAGYADPADNLAKAIKAYEHALRLLPQDIDHTLVATIQSNLGVTYEKLAEYHDTSSNLHRAITAHQQALEGLDPRRQPLQYAVTQNNLGVAYKKLADHQEPIANLKLAINAYKEGLKFVSVQNYWERSTYALMKSNLGDAHSELALHENHTANLDEALTALENSLKHLSREENPETFADAHFHLGLVHMMRERYRDGTPSVPRGLISLACSLIVFNELKLMRTQVVAEHLRTFQGVADEKRKGTFVALLRLHPAPPGCSFSPDEVIALMEKWG